jgi:translocation and assembly module TamB
MTLLAVLLALGAIVATLIWLVRSEDGSRWLLEQGQAFAPVPIEIVGVAGNLATGLAIESLHLALPAADVRGKDILVSWHPSRLLAGSFDIDSARFAELSIDLTGNDSPSGPPADLLFWLQIPLNINIESGRIDRLRVATAEFTDIALRGVIGHGRLKLKSLAAQTAGVSFQLEGKLSGPAPGKLNANGSWQFPAAQLSGSGSFAGDIDELDFTQLVQVPEPVNFNGTLYDLFTGPTLSGVAKWESIQLPGSADVWSLAGELTVTSDFRAAALAGSSVVQLEDWPAAPLQVIAQVDFQGMEIGHYQLDALGGQITGAGRINFSDDVQGQLQASATDIDTSLLSTKFVGDELKGQLGFDATLLIESTATFALDVAAVQASLEGVALSGAGGARWHDGNLLSARGRGKALAGANSLVASIETGQKLAGTIEVDAPELASLRAELRGAMRASIELGGTLKKPLGKLTLQADAAGYGGLMFEALRLQAALQNNESISADLAATGLVAAGQALGDLNLTIAGTLAEHRSKLQLAGGVAAAELSATGSWDGTLLREQLVTGRVQPDGFPAWVLQQPAQLRVAASDGELAAHCWVQDGASICVENTAWDVDNLHSEVAVKAFSLASLQHLLEEGYRMDGTINAKLELDRDPSGQRVLFAWRQTGTTLSYADELDEFTTVLDAVRIDLVSNDTQTNLRASVSGEEGLTLTATADVNGPLEDASPLRARVKGLLPSIGLLRPLVQRVVNPGDLEGQMTIDLNVSGTLGDPVFNGGAYLKDGMLELLDAGVTLSDINIAAESNRTDKLSVTGALRSGAGSATISGEVVASDKPGLLATIRVRGERLETVRLPDLSVDTSPDLVLRIGEGAFSVGGKVLIPSALAEIRELPQSAVPRSPDVVVHGVELEVLPEDETVVTGDVEVVLGEDVRFIGFGLKSRLEGSLRLTQQRGKYLRAAGTVRVRDGYLTGYGKELRVDRGDLTFTGPLDDPIINIQVSRQSYYAGRDYTVGLRLSGSAQNIKTEPYSRPVMSDNDVLSFLLLDQPTGSGAKTGGAALALGLRQIVPGEGGGILGLDEVTFETNDANEAAMVAGKRINDKLYVRYVFGTQGEPGAFRIRYRLEGGFSLEASTGAQQALDLIYLIER